MNISFVIPCYRSEKTIESVIEEIIAMVEQRQSVSFDIICVNDCSPDNVYQELERLSSKYKFVKVVDLAKNSGKPAALLAGFRYLSGEYVVTLDDDGQCPIDQLWRMIDSLDNETDVVIAKYKKKKESLFKRFGSRVNRNIQRFLVPQPKDIVFENLIVMKSFVAYEMRKYTNPYPMIAPLILQITHRIKNIQMEERERKDGRKGGYTFAKSLSLMINGFTNYSVKPLRIASLLGMIVAFTGFVYAVVIVVRKILNPMMTMGYASLMAAILVVGGILMILLGLIGEYLGRTYICQNNSPQFVIRQVLNDKSEHEIKENN